MQVVYARQPFPSRWPSSVFLAGPTPRSADVPSWRPEALRRLREAGYTGTVFVPEDASGDYRHSYLDQVTWERDGLSAADVILFWVPRELKTMPAFTTNVEFGSWVSSGKVILGYPPDAPKCRYLGWLAGEHRAPVLHTLEETVQATLDRLGEGALRAGGEREVPLHIWRTDAFQRWLSAQRGAGNTLRGARLLWSYQPRRMTQPFAWVLKVQVHIAAEDRVKHSEWVFARSDISAAVLHGPVDPDDWRRTAVVFVREFRAPGRTADGFVHELPGGSAAPGQEPALTAAEEIEEETGLHIAPDRLSRVGSRQVAGTLSSHHASVFRAALTEAELAQIRAAADAGEVFGIPGSSEHITLSVRTVAEVMADERVDWSVVGMLAAALAR